MNDEHLSLLPRKEKLQSVTLHKTPPALKANIPTTITAPNQNQMKLIAPARNRVKHLRMRFLSGLDLLRVCGGGAGRVDFPCHLALRFQGCRIGGGIVSNGQHRVNEAQNSSNGQQVVVRKPARSLRLGIRHRPRQQHDESHHQNYPDQI